MTLIVDSGGLLAAIDPNQEDYEAFKEASETAVGPLVISPFVVAELDYMILKRYGRENETRFLEGVRSGVYLLEAFFEGDFERAIEVVDRYPGFRELGISDASNVVLAERYGTPDILTTDTTHFRTITWGDGRPFRIIPDDL